MRLALIVSIAVAVLLAAGVDVATASEFVPAVYSKVSLGANPNT